MFKYCILVASVVIFVLLFSCTSPSNSPLDETLPDAPGFEALIDTFWKASDLLIVHTDALAPLAQKYADAFVEMAVQILPVDQVDQPALKAHSLLLLGDLLAHDNLADIITPLPVAATDHGVRLAGQSFTGEHLVAALPLHPHPLQPNKAVALLASQDEAAVEALLNKWLEQGSPFFRWYAWGYELYDGPNRRMVGQFDRDTWAVDTQKQFVLTSSPDTLSSPAPFELVFHDGLNANDATVKTVVAQCQQQAELLSALCQHPLETMHLPIHLYPTIEQKGLLLNNTQPCQAVLGRGTAHLVANSTFGTTALGPQNKLLLRAWLGRPQTMLLEEGLALYVNSEWQFKGCLHWAKRLAQSDNLPSLEELLDNSSGDEVSPLVRGAAAGAFVSFLLSEWGREAFVAEYAQWRPDAATVRALERAWLAYLRAEGAEAASYPTLPYLRGFNFAHEGYAIYNGYGSRLAAESLRKQAELGSNVAAIVPYSYMRNPERPTALPLMHGAGSETDESVVVSHYQARTEGMVTVLKPQVWLGGGSWPGDVAMTSEEDWVAFFDYYYRWMRHYALLAEIHRMDMLCVGVEFAQATLQRPDDWRRLTQRLRGIYSGPITYAANWGSEFEQLAFWSEVDYIGLNCYYPLSKKDNPSDEELATAFDAVLAKARSVSRQYDRPLVFTEIGFTSTPDPWKNPHVDGRGRSYAANPQKRCYRVVLEALAQEGDWCQGTLWWKFPSYLDWGGPQNTGFMPCHKPAAEVVQKYFATMEK